MQSVMYAKGHLTLWPNFRREAELFLEADYFKILSEPKGLSSRHSLVWKSDASPLNLGLV